MTTIPQHIRAEFIKAATWHGSLDKAETLLAEHPELAGADIYIAAILADHRLVQDFLAQDAALATAIAEPFGGNALVYLSLSKYLRLGKRPSEDFVKTAGLLLDAGADPNSGFWTNGEYKEFETALYGAAGVAHHVGLTQLLLDRGADPNDGEAVYHSPEDWDNGAMELLVKTGKVTPDNLCMMLIRKHDWHHYEGARLLLENGANPNHPWRQDHYPIHHALARANGLLMISLLLDHGADAHVSSGGITAIVHAARRGRNDVLALFQQRDIQLELSGVDKLIAVCATNDGEQIAAILAEEPGLADDVEAMGGHLLAGFAANGNADGLAQLLKLGIDADTPFAEGDGYFGIPKNSQTIHIAAWRGYPEVVKILLAAGAMADRPDANGNTPLMLAVQACVNSYWMVRRSPDAVEALLKAGAQAERVPFPSGYAAVDELLLQYRDK